jgi:uncharacterized membrane protein YhaH (DUF805 family)
MSKTTSVWKQTGSDMKFVDAALHVLANYFNFQGRADRTEYWSWMIIRFAVLSGLVLLGLVTVIFADHGASGEAFWVSLNALGWIVPSFVLFFLATLLPDIAVSVRRLHDTDRSGWWLLWMNIIPGVGFILLIAFLLESDPKENQFGPPSQPAN